MLLDDHYVVAPAGKVLRDERAHVARPRDDDAHRFLRHSGAPILFRSSTRPGRSLLTTETWMMSPSWNAKSLSGMRGTPKRLTATILRRPSRSASRALFPMTSCGTGIAVTTTSPLSTVYSTGTSSGIRVRRIWSVVHLTVATVWMPRRW